MINQVLEVIEKYSSSGESRLCSSEVSQLYAKSLQSCLTVCNPIDSSPPGTPSLGFSRQEHWSGLPLPSLRHESEKWKWSHSVVSDSSRPHGLQPTRSSAHGIFQARVLEWGAIAFSELTTREWQICYSWWTCTDITKSSEVHSLH